MSYLKSVEQIINEAIARGDFDNLHGQGQPLDLTAYFQTPAEFRLAYKMLKDAGYVPEELEMRAEIEALKGRLQRCQDDEEQRRLKREIHQKTLMFDLLMERNKRTRRST
jgi:hypothetical protein